jgi:hypothetical protein
VGAIGKLFGRASPRTLEQLLEIRCAHQSEEEEKEDHPDAHVNDVKGCIKNVRTMTAMQRSHTWQTLSLHSAVYYRWLILPRLQYCGSSSSSSGMEMLTTCTCINAREDGASGREDGGSSRGGDSEHGAREDGRSSGGASVSMVQETMEEAVEEPVSMVQERME